MSTPLEGIRVIDFGQIYAAPYCTLQLAAMGAEIIKVEPPEGGELLRQPGLSPGGVSYSFLMLNANKKSVTLNLKHPRGQEIALKLLEDADVLVENYLDGVMKGKGGFNYGERTGLCLECQHFPDSPNEKNFPTTALEPGQAYTQTTLYRFSVDQGR